MVSEICYGLYSTFEKAVLILVLVEDGLRAFEKFEEIFNELSLNPCSCGRWSQSLKDHDIKYDLIEKS